MTPDVLGIIRFEIISEPIIAGRVIDSPSPNKTAKICNGPTGTDGSTLVSDSIIMNTK